MGQMLKIIEGSPGKCRVRRVNRMHGVHDVGTAKQAVSHTGCNIGVKRKLIIKEDRDSQQLKKGK